MGRNELENAKFSVDSLHYVNQLNSLVPDKYDYISLGDFTGSEPQTVVFKINGATGTTVATLALGYSGVNGAAELVSVTKT